MALTKEQRDANRRLARKLGYKDADGNGVPDKDKLTREEMAAEYGYALNVIYANNELKTLFERALSDKKGTWTPQKFSTAIQNSEWYKTNDVYAREAWTREQVGGADWQTRISSAREAIQQRAAQLGADLSGPEIDALARRFEYEGWGTSGRGGLLDKALSEEISYMPDERGGSGVFRGAAGNFVDNLRAIAQANGVSYSDSWYQSAARSVASGLKTEDDFIRDVRTLAAGKWGAWGDKIKAGEDAYSLASPYINTMADELEISPNSITLNDPYVSQAMMGTDAQGNPAPMSLWDFQRKLRNDPRWMNTNKAQNQVTSVSDAVMRMFGLRG